MALIAFANALDLIVTFRMDITCFVIDFMRTLPSKTSIHKNVTHQFHGIISISSSFKFQT